VSLVKPWVLEAIESEMRYQNAKWGADKEQSLPGFLLVMKRELAEAEEGWIKGHEERDSALAEIVQVVATGIQCLNRYGVVGCPKASNDYGARGNN